ncbi:MAG: hypothetical protein VR64_10385 [Desulfatitalea sp. BRH_c12]|nr:MAG: hypothetical protein VR64_10385 [Desulfatitalea sp. BRH_c12]
MQWTEIIHVRAFSQDFRERALEEAQELSLTGAPEALEAITLWRRSDLPTDLNIVLRWSEQQDQQAHSSVGLQLAKSFSRFGWVSHSMWSDPKGIGKTDHAKRALNMDDAQEVKLTLP